MASFTKPSDLFMMKRVVDLSFGGNKSMQKLLKCALMARMEDEDDDEDDEEIECGVNDVHWDDELQTYYITGGSRKIKSYEKFQEMHSSGLLGCPADSEDWEDEESDGERKASLLLQEKIIKADKKRLKKLRQKEKKRQQKELQTSTQNKKTKDIPKADKAEDKPCSDKTKECFNLKDMATAIESESSDYTSASSEDEKEGLDLNSSFVSKAAEIAKRQLEQKQEKEKKKSPPKEEAKTPEKSTCEESHVEKKAYSPKMEDFVKMSTQFATYGNKLASAGNFKLAVTYFTNAIKCNPKEFRLFGNRAFCFEKMQEFDKALNDAELSLSMSPGWVKGLFRKGRALAGLKRYEEAASAFKEVVKLDPSCTEAAQELVRVQILQLMEYGFTQDQSSKALIIHGSVEKAREVLSRLNKQAELSPATHVQPQQVVNMTGLSPILSAKMTSAAASLPPVQGLPDYFNTKSHQSLPKHEDYGPSKPKYGTQATELFPVWVGNLAFSVTEPLLETLFAKVGTVYSLKHLPARRCAFVNFTQQQDCDDAIRRYHGYELFGSKLAVRYPDRIPGGLNISKSALKSTGTVPDEDLKHSPYAAGRPGYGKPLYYKSPGKY